MVQFPRAHTCVRSPRVTVPGANRFTLLVDGRSTSGTLQKLSLTGGCGELGNALQQNTLAHISLQTRLGAISGVVEMLSVVSADAPSQAFRFVALSDRDHYRLSETLHQMSRQELVQASINW